MEEKKILVINYSQTGQLDDILSSFLQPLQEHTIDWVKVEPKDPFEFPWNTARFFDAMPESVLEETAEIQPLTFDFERYDLIVLGYQPWFLSPSIPTSSLLANKDFRARLKGTSVLTITGARNMWLNAHDSIMRELEESGAQLVGHVPFIDRHGNLPSAVAILHWMLKGKKTRKWGIFPPPGVADKDIAAASDFGGILSEQLQLNELSSLQERFVSLNQFHISTTVLFIEGRAKKLFQIWARLIKRKGTSPKKRKRWLSVFKYYLIFALFIVSPIVMLIYSILVRPFTQGSIRKKKDYYYHSGVGKEKV